MTRRFWIGIAGALFTLGVGAPAFAQQYYYAPDGHDVYHQEQNEEHALEHEQLEVEHGQEHMQLGEEHARLHAMGYGDDPFSHWLMHRHLAREHRMEHMREEMQHAREHQQLEGEHNQYHQMTDPYYGYGYGGSYYVPQYRGNRYSW